MNYAALPIIISGRGFIITQRCRSQNHMGASNLFNDALGFALLADALAHTSEKYVLT